MGYKKNVNIQYDAAEYERLLERARAAHMPLATFIRSLSLAEQHAIADRIIPDAAVRGGVAQENRFGCPAYCAPCADAEHSAAEARIERELAPRLRAKIAPRGASEGPHEYIARYWAAEELQADFLRDQAAAFGWD